MTWSVEQWEQALIRWVERNDPRQQENKIVCTGTKIAHRDTMAQFLPPIKNEEPKK